MKSADLIISRAGASTIAEIVATKIPSILVPSPYVANNHQYYNALELVNKNVAVMLEEKDLNEKNLVDTINKIFDPKKYEMYKNNLKEIKDRASSSIIMEEVNKRIKGKNEKEKEV